MKRFLIAAAAVAVPFAANAGQNDLDITINANMPEVCIIATPTSDINALAEAPDFTIERGALNNGTDTDGETNYASWVVTPKADTIRIFCNTDATISLSATGDEFALVNDDYTDVQDGFETKVPFYVVLDSQVSGQDLRFDASGDQFSQEGWDRTLQPRIGFSERIKAMKGDYTSTVTVTVLPN